MKIAMVLLALLAISGCADGDIPASVIYRCIDRCKANEDVYIMYHDHIGQGKVIAGCHCKNGARFTVVE